MVNMVVWMAVGAIIGLLGSIALHTEAERGTLINIVMGVAGALAAELILAPLFRITSLGGSDFGLPALVGAIGLLATFSVFRYMAQRYRPEE